MEQDLEYIEVNKRAVGKARFKDDYPINLLKELNVDIYSEKKVDYNNISKDQLKGLEHAISTLKDREKTILLLRFKEKMTYRQIGDEYYLTASRIMQIVKKCMRMLKHPSRMNYIIKGYDGYLKSND